MKHSALIAISACLCAFSGAKADDGSGYVAPVPLREAVTVTGPPTDINDDTAIVTDKKSPVEVAETLRKDGPDTFEGPAQHSNPQKPEGEAAAVTSSDIQEIVGTPEAAVQETNEATVDTAKPEIPQLDEVAKKSPGATLTRTGSGYIDHVTEMMGGEFNTETNQRMAESFLSSRPLLMRLRANRDF